VLHDATALAAREMNCRVLSDVTREFSPVSRNADVFGAQRGDFKPVSLARLSTRKRTFPGQVLHVGQEKKVAAMMPTDCAGQRRRRLIAPWFGTDGSTYLQRVI
jgi:hypothetical protein